MASDRLRPVLIVPDCHAPFHSVDGWELMLDVARDLKPERIVVMGDFLDCYSVSRHSKDPARQSNLDGEIAVARGLLDELDALGATEKDFLEGNHEFRLVRYMEERAPELHGLLEIPKLLRLEERGWRWTPYRQDIRHGKMHYVHDVGYAGRYAVHRTLDAFQHSVASVHTHRMAVVYEGNSTGESKVSAQFGWLGDVDQVDYMHRARAKKDWALGFGIGYEDRKTGHCFLQPVPIVQGRCVVNGKLWKAPRKRKGKR